MIRLLLDQGLPRTAAMLLRAQGIDTTHVGELNMSQVTDTVILAYARTEDRIVVTLDADFHTLLALSNATKPSVMRLRLEGLQSAEAAALIERVLASTTPDLLAGAAIVVTATGIRIKNLPILG